MSVPVGLRNVWQNEPNRKSIVVTNCTELYLHCTKCCSSKKVTESMFQKLRSHIEDESLLLYDLCYEANKVPYYKGRITQEQYEERCECITAAIKICDQLYGHITLGKQAFKWRQRKIDYWCGLIDKTRASIVEWYNWCKNEYEG